MNITHMVLNNLLYSSSPLFSLIKISNLSISSHSTCLKLPLARCSHSIISKNMCNVALRSSISGTSVTSKNGPTMDGMKCSLHSPRVMHLSLKNINNRSYNRTTDEPNWDHMDRIWKPISTLISPYFSIIFSLLTSENCSNCKEC